MYFQKIYVFIFTSFLFGLKNQIIVVKAQTTMGRTQEYGTSGNSNIENANSVANNGGGEVISPRASALSSHEPSCEELRAMWRYNMNKKRYINTIKIDL